MKKIDPPEFAALTASIAAGPAHSPAEGGSEAAEKAAKGVVQEFVLNGCEACAALMAAGAKCEQCTVSESQEHAVPEFGADDSAEAFVRNLQREVLPVYAILRGMHMHVKDYEAAEVQAAVVVAFAR